MSPSPFESRGMCRGPFGGRAAGRPSEFKRRRTRGRTTLAVFAALLPFLATVSPSTFSGTRGGWRFDLGPARAEGLFLGRIRDAAKDAFNQVKDGVNRAWDGARRGWAEAKDHSRRLFESARNAAGAMMGQARDLANQAIGTAGDLANRAREQATQVANDLRNAVGAAIAGVRDLGDRIKGAILAAVDAAKKAVESALAAARAALANLPLPFAGGGGLEVPVWPEPKVTCAIDLTKLGDSIKTCDAKLTTALLGLAERIQAKVNDAAFVAFERVLEELGDALLAGTATTNNAGQLLLRKAEDLADKAIQSVVRVSARSIIDRIGSMLGVVPLAGAALRKLSELVTQGARVLRSQVVALLLSGTGKLLDSLAVFVARAGTKVLKTAGYTRGLVQEMQKRFEPLKRCLVKNVNDLKGQGIALFTDVVRDPKGALRTWGNKAFTWLKQYGRNVVDLLKGVMGAFKLAVQPPKLGSDGGIDAKQWDDFISKTIPNEIRARAKAVAKKLQQTFTQGALKIMRGTPQECFVRVIVGVIGQNQSLIDTVVSRIADGVANTFAGFTKHFPKIIEKVLEIVHELVMQDSTAQKLQSAVSTVFLGKLGRIDRMVTEARAAVRRGDRASIAKARNTAEQLKNEIPFLNFRFWLNLLRQPIIDGFKKVSNDLIGFGIQVPVILATLLYDMFDGVWKWLGEVIPNFADEIPSWLDVTIAFIKLLVKSILPEVQEWSTKIAQILNDAAINLSANIAFTALEKGLGAADAALTTFRTQQMRRLPMPAPLRLVASAIQSLYDRFVRPYLGAMQTHVSYLSSFIYGLTGQKKCFQQGAKAQAAPKRQGGKR